MGCDIHAATEQYVDDKWVMVDRLHWSLRATERNYKRFAALANVRGDGPLPLGLPNDISESTRLYRDEWGVDGHSDSWLPLPDASLVWLNTDYKDTSDYVKEYPESHYFDIEIESYPGQYRVVFWFDN